MENGQMGLVQLVYVSQAVNPMSETQLRELAARCVHNNAVQDITGLLLYSRAQFMQLLEGEERAVLKVYETVKSDSRHTAIEVLLEAPANSRLFAHWSMGLLNLDHASHAIDRDRLQHVLKRAMLFKWAGTGTPGMEALELLKHFRAQLPAIERSARACSAA